MVKNIEQLTAELKFFGFRQPNVLEGRGIPVHVSRALDHVAAFVPKDLESAEWIRLELLKSAYVEPFLRRARTRVWVANQIGAVRGKAGDFRRLPLQRNIIRVEYRERAAAHSGHDSVQLPVAKNVTIPASGVLQERKDPLITQYETMVGIEHGSAALRRKIKGILRQIIFSGNWLRRRPRNVEGRNIIDGVRPRVGREERQAVVEAFSQAGFKGVIAGVRDAGDFTDRTVDAIVGVR